MDRNRCLILGAEPVDSNSLNRCLMNLYDFADEKCSQSINLTSENVPSSPFFSGGYHNALTDIDYVSAIGFVQDGASAATPITSASTANYGIARRLYGNSLQECLTINENFATETATGVYNYTEDDVAEFVPTVGTLFTDDLPLVLAPSVDDDTKTITTGLSALGCQSTPTVKYTSYIVCGYTGISFGQITFSRKNAEVQNNVVTLNITRDLINRDDVDRIKFFSVSNGMASGVRRVSENLDMVSDINACNITYTSDDDVVISNITKNDNSNIIRVDKDTGRILDDDEEREYGDYVELTNDTISLNFFVVFETRKDYVTYDEGTWCFYLCDDYDYARRKLSKADSYARGSISYRFLGFEAADDGYEDYMADNPHQVYNVIKSSKDAFRGCFNATFPLLSHFSSAYEYADRMFKDCHHATFDSLPSCAYLPRLKTAVSMFEGCAAADFGNLKTIYFPRSTKITKMFSGCRGALFSELESIDVAGSCGYMFYGDYNAEFKKLSEIRGTATVLDSMFEKCTNSDFRSLVSISSSSDGIVRSCSMFSGLSANEFPRLERIDLGKECYNSNGMFRNCTNATFESLTSIGEPQIAEYQFYGCSTATFGGISSLGSHLVDSMHMFQNCTSLDMEIWEDLTLLANATEMFENANVVTIWGDMNELMFADRMCANMESAVIYGDMDALKSGRSVFVNTGTACVYGSVDSLIDADSMFMNTDVAVMSEVPHSLVYMLSMFSNSKNCSVWDYQSAVALPVSETTVQNRISDSAFSYAGNVEITGNIFDGDLESTSNMFMNAGSVRLFNPDMASPTDAANRYYYHDSNVLYTVVRGLSQDGLTTVYANADYSAIPEDAKKDAFALTVGITNDATEYGMNISSAEFSYYRSVAEDDYDYLAAAYSVFGRDGVQYFFSKADFGGGTAWTVNRVEDEVTKYLYNVEVVKNIETPTLKSTTVKYLEPEEDGEIYEGGSCEVLMQRTSETATYELGISAKVGGYRRLYDGFETADFSVDVNYTIVDGGTDAVVVITSPDGSENMFHLCRDGSIVAFTDRDQLLIDGDSEPAVTAKLYCIYRDEAKSSPFGFMIAMRKRDSLDTKYYLFAGDYGDRLVDFTTEQGDIYSLDVVIDGSSTELSGTKVEIGIQESGGEIATTFIEADEMFRNVVTDSLLSGYDSVMSRTLTTTRGMFSLDERVEDDPTFRNVGHVFSFMDSTDIVDSSEMFKNRVVCDANAFYDNGIGDNVKYSLHVPKRVVDAVSMFQNCTVSASGAEVGVNIPSSLVHASDMFNGFDGGIVRLGYGSRGSITLNSDLEYDGMFKDVKFANTERNNYELTIPRVNMSVFRGSDFLFNSIDHITETNGRYFAPHNMSAGQRSELDNTEKIFETDAVGGAELGSLDNDLSRWFDEGIYLATVLGPSGNEYRIQTEYLTGGRMRGHYRMADCNPNAESGHRLLSLSAYTQNFRASNMSEIRGERIAAMFSPWVAINCSDTTVGDGMVYLMEPNSFESLPMMLESNFGRNYPSAEFNKVKTISTNEMPFAFAGLKSGVFANVTAISGGTVNAAGAFMNSPSATFSALKKIDITDVPTVGVFESAYTDIEATSGRIWSGNYVDMFANDVSAKFNSLESILVKSRFFRLYPISEALDEGWYDFPESAGDTFEFGERDNYYFHFIDFDNGGFASFAIHDAAGNRIAEFRTSMTVEGSGLKVHLIEIGEYADPCVEVRLSTLIDGVEDIKERWLVYRNGYVEGTPTTNPDPRYYLSNYLLTYFTQDSRNRGVLNFDLKSVKSWTSHLISVDESGDTLEIVFRNNDTSSGARETRYDTGIPSSVDYVLGEEFGEINEDCTDTELDYHVIIIVTITVNGEKRYYTATPMSDIAESGPEFDIKESAFHPASNDIDKTKRGTYNLTNNQEQTILFGKNEYIVRFSHSEGGTYSLSICDSDDVELACFDTGITADVVKARLELLETEAYNDDSHETESAIVFRFLNTSFKFVAFKSGMIVEDSDFPETVKYRHLCSYSDNEYFVTESTAHCDGMFMNCSSATFEKLKTVSLAGIGSCAKMFAGCTSAKIKGLDTLYLPEAYSDKDANGKSDGGAHCYGGLFSGCDVDNIDLSSLDAITTNLHSIGYGTSKTNGTALFSGMSVEIRSSDDALKHLGLKREIGDLMEWE